MEGPLKKSFTLRNTDSNGRITKALNYGLSQLWETQRKLYVRITM